MPTKSDVYLLPMTAEMYHAYFKEYENDPDLYIDKNAYTPYTYDADKVNRYIQRQTKLKRIPFAIMHSHEMVGELIFKDVVPGERATMGLALKSAKYKDRGYGTQAEQLAIAYVFQILDIPTLYADSIVSNTRSQHVLEKVGFRLINQDGTFKYYRIDR